MELRDFCKHSFSQYMFTCIIFATTCYLGCLYSFRAEVKEPCVWLPRAVEVSAASLTSPRWTQDIFLAFCYSGHLGHLLPVFSPLTVFPIPAIQNIIYIFIKLQNNNKNPNSPLKEKMLNHNSFVQHIHPSTISQHPCLGTCL